MPWNRTRLLWKEKVQEVSPRIVNVLLTLPVERTYAYAVPAGWAMPPAGAWVLAQAAGRACVGVVWGEALVAPQVGQSKAQSKAQNKTSAKKPIVVAPLAEVLPAPLLDAPMREFLLWSANYTLNPVGSLLAASGRVREALKISDAETKSRKRKTIVLPDLNETLGKTAPLQLSVAQADAVANLQGKIGAGAFSVTLLEGVTGAGKSEVYLSALREVLLAGGQALVLLPEISLSEDWQRRLQARLGFAPLLWHSSLTPAVRRETWLAAARGEAPLIVGARSALFLPLPRLAAIVVDEEHDPAFKQEDGILYHARDLAVARGLCQQVAVALVSATPSLESLVNVERGRYERVRLPERHQAVRGALLPEVEAVDLRKFAPVYPVVDKDKEKEKKRGRRKAAWLSAPLVEALDDTLQAGAQSLLFLNRRGYAPLMLCGKCGLRLQCKDCTAWLVLHEPKHGARAMRLDCHHCGRVERVPETCAACAFDGREENEGEVAPLGPWRACGPGVERVAEEVRVRFPSARVAVASSDRVAFSDGSAGTLAEVFSRLSSNALDILIGTQIIGKGHHFAGLNLVGIVDADLGLQGGDLRALERSWQVLCQVAGRAGGGADGRAGRVLVQTRLPEHPVMEALLSGDGAAFLRREKEARRAAGMPPFGRLAAVVLSASSLPALDEYALRLRGVVPSWAGVQVLGPAPAPIAVLRRRHRCRFLVRARSGVRLQDFMRAWLARATPPRSIRRTVDIDPQSFL